MHRHLLTPRSTVAASVTRMVVYIQALDAEYVEKSDIDCMTPKYTYFGCADEPHKSYPPMVFTGASLKLAVD